MLCSITEHMLSSAVLVWRFLTYSPYRYFFFKLKYSWFTVFQVYSRVIQLWHCCCSFAQLCPTLCDPMDCTVFQSLPKFMSIELVMTSNHLIVCCPLILLPSIFPSIKIQLYIYTYIHTWLFSNSFPWQVIIRYVYSSLCYTVGPWVLFYVQ